MNSKPEGKAYGIPAEDEPGLRFDLFVCYVYTKLSELPVYHRKNAYKQLTEGTTHNKDDIHRAVIAKFKRNEEQHKF